MWLQNFWPLSFCFPRQAPAQSALNTGAEEILRASCSAAAAEAPHVAPSPCVDLSRSRHTCSGTSYVQGGAVQSSASRPQPGCCSMQHVLAQLPERQSESGQQPESAMEPLMPSSVHDGGASGTCPLVYVSSEEAHALEMGINACSKTWVLILQSPLGTCGGCYQAVPLAINLLYSCLPFTGFNAAHMLPRTPAVVAAAVAGAGRSTPAVSTPAANAKTCFKPGQDAPLLVHTTPLELRCGAPRLAFLHPDSVWG